MCLSVFLVMVLLLTSPNYVIVCRWGMCTRQMTMHEALGAGSTRDQVVPVLHQACDQVMYEGVYGVAMALNALSFDRKKD